jgi:hypothetical protein
MDEKQKKQVLIAILASCWAFMGWWLLLSHGGIGGLITALLVAAVAGGVAWFATGVLA